MPDELLAEHAFTAEHIFPWMWEDYAGLRSHQAAAELLAEHEWPRLYDPDQLARNEVPVAATIYVNDLYVERALRRGDCGLDPRPAALDHERVRAQRPARRRRARARPADRPRARPRVTPSALTGTARSTVSPPSIEPLIVPIWRSPSSSPKTMSLDRLRPLIVWTLCLVARRSRRPASQMSSGSAICEVAILLATSVAASRLG